MARGVRRVNIKMMRSHVCNNCNKRLSSYHSLWRHKRNAICKGKGIDIPIPSKFSGKEKLSRILDGVTIKKKELNNDDSDTESDKEDDVHGFNLPIITENQKELEIDSDSEKDEETSSDDENEADDVFLWEKFIMSCNKEFFQWLEEIIKLYIWSQKDELFERLIADVTSFKNLGYTSPDASDYAVYKNVKDIMEAVKDCEDSQKDVFWCALANRDIQIGCLWFTGLKCRCDECIGNSLLDTVSIFVRTFYAMGHDKIIQKIVKDDDIEKSIQRYREEIIDQCEKAQNFIETLGIVKDPERPTFRWKKDTGNTDSDNEPSGSGMYLNPYVVH